MSRRGSSSRLEREYPGATADQPKEIPAKGWFQVTKRAWAESKVDQVPLLAAGVAFYSFLSLFPAMIAAVTVYGLVADPQTVARQAEAISNALPSSAASLITDQMKQIAAQPQQSLGLGLLIALPWRSGAPRAASGTSSPRSTSPTTRRRPAG